MVRCCVDKVFSKIVLFFVDFISVSQWVVKIQIAIKLQKGVVMNSKLRKDIPKRFQVLFLGHD